MPPQIAFWLCTIFIVFLFWNDFKQKHAVSYALWVPFIWILIVASKPLSIWLNFGVPVYFENQEQYLEGSPTDRNFLLFLIIVGFTILFRRQLEWSKIFGKNKWIIFYFLYCGISTLWSDYTFVSFKRWIKEVGNFTMILIILTEHDPVEAFKTICRRLTYIVVPFSIVFIKYIPAIGRAFSRTGEAMYTGVTDHKNSLGILSFICFTVFFWNLQSIRKNKNKDSDKYEMRIHILFLLLIVWLLIKSQSATAILCTVIGVIFLMGFDWSIIKKNLKSISIFIVIIICVFAFLQYSIEIFQFIVVDLLDRNLTLTGRTTIWSELLVIGTDPLIGSGYESYWLGDRVNALKERYVFNLNQAHNGYLEMYLNLGWIGLCSFIMFIVSTYKNISNKLPHDFHYQKLRMTFLVIILLMNITEAYFKGLSLSWVVLLLIATEATAESGSIHIEQRKQHP